ncbi:MAG: hypothetical protein FJ265_03895 [Planctomycetes bacterium]|nr:hypothetical protein [Planctomycetota bacterium]
MGPDPLDPPEHTRQCQFTPPSCGPYFGPPTGLAVDRGRRILHATDGNNTMAMDYVPALGCVLGPNVVTGPGNCNGSTRFGFPLPGNATLAGWTMSSQCIAVCSAAAGIGTAVSNCISWTLQGN